MVKYINVLRLINHFASVYLLTGAAVGFRLDSLLKLTDTRATNNKMTLMHYLCKVWNSLSVAVLVHIYVLLPSFQI
jgi:formin 2